MQQGESSVFHMLCPRYDGTLTLSVPTTARLQETVTFFFFFIFYGKSTHLLFKAHEKVMSRTGTTVYYILPYTSNGKGQNKIARKEKIKALQALHDAPPLR